jgi:enamine deaminase RidA (YjgF/YER057c/UK114 family)
VGDRVLVSGTAPVWPDGSCDPDPAAQARRCVEIVRSALAELGVGLEDVVRTRVFLTDAADAGAVSAVHGEAFGTARPAATIGRGGGPAGSAMARGDRGRGRRASPA